MSDEVFTSIQTTRALRNHGRYAEATGDLEELIQRMGPDIRLVVELSETLLIQGFVSRVVEVLDKHLADCSPRDTLNVASGQLLRCLSTFLATGQFRESLSHAEMVYNSIVSRLESKIVNDATVRIETFYCKLRYSAAYFGLFDDSHIHGKLITRLRNMFDILQERGDYFNALSVARTHNACCGTLDKNFLVKILAESDQTPALYRAHAQFLLASAIESKELRDEQDRLYTLALKSFKDNNHVHGILDTEIAIMCRLPIDPDDITIGERLSNCLKCYESLNYPAGFVNILLQLLNVYHQLFTFKLSEDLAFDDVETLFSASNSKVMWLSLRISALAKRLVSGGNYGKIIHGGEALWNDLIGSDCKFLRGSVAQLISRAYFALDDGELMTMWSQRAQNDIPQTNLTAVPSLTKGFDLNSIQGLTQCYQMISVLANPESKDYSSKNAVEMIEVLINEAFLHRSRDAQSYDIIDRAIKLYEENLSRLTHTNFSPVMMARLRNMQATMLTLKASSGHEFGSELAALNAFGESGDYYLKSNQIDQAIFILQREALFNVSRAQNFERTREDARAKLAWQNALDQYKIALEEANNLCLTQISCDFAYWVAFCEYRQWARGWCSAETLLKSLRAAESSVDRRRQEVSILGGIDAAVFKGRLSSNEHVRNIYRIAIQVCIGIGNMLDAWIWIQKSKARSLSDLLGLGVFIPKELKGRIQQDLTCRELFEDEHRLVEDLTSVADTERFKVRIKLDNHEEIMRRHASLAELLDLREGVPISLDDLLTDGVKYRKKDRCDQKTIFVDWIVADSEISMYVVKEGEKPILKELPITTQTVQIWVSEHLNNENETALSWLNGEDEVGESPLRDLDILVAPLVELSNSNDLLVLCPTGLLHSIPLHALCVGNQEFLIERNLIVYCASLTSYVQCCRRADSRTTAKLNKRLLAVYEREPEYENGDSQQFNDERRGIYSSTERLAEEFNGEPLCGENVTLQSFKDSLECADFVHFFGHCDYAPKLVAEQSLCIFGEKEDNQPKYVTVKDLFNFRINASHISLLACASAAQRFQAGDEPLGLVTAFLSAGATSVLGTLWPVQSTAARLFSEYFYTHLLQSTQEESQHIIYDLAYATREAILDIKQDWEFRQPYHWASFVLHGAWFWKGDPNSR